LGNPLMYARAGVDIKDVTFAGTLFGVTVLRVSSFFGEPKDVALYIMPALAYVWTKVRLPGLRPERHAWVRKVQLVLFLIVGLLSFSSSFILMLPVLFVTLMVLEPRMTRQRKRVWLSILVLLCTTPLFAALWQTREALHRSLIS
jgi:hypothetical protein